MGSIRRPRLVIFDCAGVLVDSERLIIAVESKVLTELGWELYEGAIVRRFVGRPSEHTMKEVERRLGSLLARRFREVVTVEMAELFRTQLRAVGGVEHLVRSLGASGVATCVASSGSHQKMEMTLGYTNLRHLFEGRIYSAFEVPSGKPAPARFLHAARSMGYRPAESVVVEDSSVGVEAAVTAGMVCYGFGQGVTPVADLEAAGAIVFDTMTELGEMLEHAGLLSS